VAPVASRNKKATIDAPRRRRIRAAGASGPPAHPGHLQADQGRPSSARRTRHKRRPDVRPYQEDKDRTEFLDFCRYLRSLYPPEVRIAIVCDNFSPHLSTKKDSRVGDWAAENNVEIACVPTNASYLNRIECHFTALRCFALNCTDHQSHEEQNSMIRRYIAWRNRHTDNPALRAVSLGAKVA
jgi:hypothetical protein